MSTVKTAYDDPALSGKPIARDQARALLGQVMGVVAVAVGFAALGACLGRDLSGATGLVLFIGAFACIFGLNVAAAKGREQLAIGLLFGLGLLLGLAVAPVVADYAKADPSALWQAAGATAAFVAACGAYGYATRRGPPSAASGTSSRSHNRAQWASRVPRQSHSACGASTRTRTEFGKWAGRNAPAFIAGHASRSLLGQPRLARKARPAVVGPAHPLTAKRVLPRGARRVAKLSRNPANCG
jgi:Inhibitor of apoptosis-promoting Bax1